MHFKLPASLTMSVKKTANLHVIKHII